ncbi:FAD/NAD(P)-binding domain-containing protein [Trichoderma citrinoviride]|uniref:FAD/NAD(P)-binding domain-containing protein n=1 Tax=Trichoderma citrinoviride TaxID=58853 RepID=A0A2T4B1U1_9HYPO|nr:FAD/NAD(P)-binding domain-containing protein [Trichoderma citrinoviride]PTB63292.1 FAD/NAD(P)-binding domain-containing protein [Trichoderma citrinoviride]
MADSSKPFRVLIAGAGIAGLATAISLTRISGIPDLDIQLYEQAPELREIGASIALSPNGLRTLEKLGVDSALSDEVGFRGPSGIPHFYRHWKTNQVVSVDTFSNVSDRRHQTTRFHRGHLHAALLEHVPREWIHLNKKISRAEANDDGVSLYFEDGTSAHGDILLGADGIRSQVRGSFYPEYKLRFSGKVFMRSTFDASLVEGKVLDLPADAAHWWGTKDTFFSSRLGKGLYTVVGAYDDGRSAEELEKSITWDQAGNVQFLRQKYKDWHPVVKTLTELTPHARLYPNYAGDALPSWIPASRVTLVGDAAHTHGGSFAAGGSLALDDSLALGLAFKHVFSPGAAIVPLSQENIRRALSLYDQTRRPHTARLLSIVHGLINRTAPTFATPEEEDEALRARMRNRPDLQWLSEHDVEKAFAQVVADSEKQGLYSTEGSRTPRSGYLPEIALRALESKL